MMTYDQFDQLPPAHHVALNRHALRMRCDPQDDPLLDPVILDLLRFGLLARTDDFSCELTIHAHHLRQESGRRWIDDWFRQPAAADTAGPTP